MRKVYKNVYVGDIFDAEVEGESFDRVICVSQNETDYTTEYIPLEDSDQCEYDSFSKAADSVLRAFESDEGTLLHCNMGASRSVAVAAAALSRETGKSIDFCVKKIQCGPHEPLPTLKEHARRYSNG